MSETPYTDREAVRALFDEISAFTDTLSDIRNGLPIGTTTSATLPDDALDVLIDRAAHLLPDLERSISAVKPHIPEILERVQRAADRADTGRDKLLDLLTGNLAVIDSLDAERQRRREASAKIIADLRATGLSHRDIAAATGVSHVTTQRMERGVEPTVDQVAARIHAVLVKHGPLPVSVIRSRYLSARARAHTDAAVTMLIEQGRVTRGERGVLTAKDDDLIAKGIEMLETIDAAEGKALAESRKIIEGLLAKKRGVSQS